VISILPEFGGTSDVKLNLKYYDDIINKVLSIVVLNQISMKSFEIPLISDQILNYLEYFDIESLVVLDFFICEHDSDKLNEILSKSKINKISYLCDNSNNLNCKQSRSNVQ
jgi:hypothetical protein